MINIDPKVLKLLRGYRFTLQNEKALQLEMEILLNQNDVEFVREHILSKKDIIDFIVPDNIGVEVKIGGSIQAIYRQCERYCQFDRISGILLLTNRAMALPELINNKPTMVINLGKAWL